MHDVAHKVIQNILDVALVINMHWRTEKLLDCWLGQSNSQSPKCFEEHVE